MPARQSVSRASRVEPKRISRRRTREAAIRAELRKRIISRKAKARLRAELAKLRNEIADLMRQSASQWVDSDDAPEWTPEMFKRADLYHGDKLIRRGRPPSNNPKQAIKLRIDADVIEHFRATGPGWQTRMNDALRRAAKL